MNVGFEPWKLLYTIRLSDHAIRVKALKRSEFGV